MIGLKQPVLGMLLLAYQSLFDQGSIHEDRVIVSGQDAGRGI